MSRETFALLSTAEAVIAESVRVAATGDTGTGHQEHGDPKAILDGNDGLGVSEVKTEGLVWNGVQPITCPLQTQQVYSGLILIAREGNRQLL